jgi:hypothetical protein
MNNNKKKNTENVLVENSTELISKNENTKNKITKNEITKNKITKNKITKNENTKNENTKNENTNDLNLNTNSNPKTDSKTDLNTDPNTDPNTTIKTKAKTKERINLYNDENLDLNEYNDTNRSITSDKKKGTKYTELNERTEEGISSFSDFIRSFFIFMNNIQYLWDSSPIIIKVANISSTLLLTYIFTSKVYILFLSVLFFLVSAFFLYLTNSMFCVIYILFYSIYLFQIIYKRNRYIGNSIPETSLSKNKKPYLCAGDDDGLDISPKTLPTDENGGYFSYSFWVYINALKNVEKNDSYNFTWKNYRYTEWKNVFYRGTQTDDVELMVQYPGVWLTPKMNNMVIVFRQSGYPVERFEISNIDLNKWVNITIVSKMKSISIFVDGLFQKSVTLNQSAPLLKDYHLYIANDANLSPEGGESKRGFPGFLAEFIYFNHELSPDEVMECYKFYKRRIDKYQSKVMSQKKDSSSKLIQNADKLKKKIN